MPRPDERDTIFSRMTLEPGSDRYQDYYSRHPEREVLDNEFRSAPPGEYAHQTLDIQMVDETFGLIAEMRPMVRGPIASEQVQVDPSEAADYLKQNALNLGASDAGIADIDPSHLYAIRGRGERYGRPVDDVEVLPRILVFVIEMDKDEIRQAPEARQSAEVVRGYLKAAMVALSTARFIRSLGWEAVAHIDGESEVVLPPAAAAAGLGEIGHHGLLVTRQYGSRVRLSAVTSNMPLSTDAPAATVPKGLADFCSRCDKCAESCPAGAIDAGTVNHEACFSMWKQFGTDCGICLAVCPFS